MSSACRLAASKMNWTPATPMLSAAVAATATCPDTVAPFVGDVTLIVGGVVSGAGAEVVNVASGEVARLFDESADFTR